MNQQPTVSVLMPIYKTPVSFLKEAIDSILNQTFTDFELLIIDDCPDDDRADIVNSYTDNRIKYIKNEQNLGISPTRNKLIEMARGKYLAVMDHDDISLPTRFEKQVTFLENNPTVGVVGSWYKNYPNGKIKKRYVLDKQLQPELLFFYTILHPASMIRKTVLIDNNIRYEEEFSPAEDYALWGRLIGKTKFANIPEVLFFYRGHETNTSKIQAKKMKEGVEKIYKFMHEENPELYSNSYTKKEIRLFNIPVFSYERKACTHYYKLFNCIKFKRKDKIKYQ